MQKINAMNTELLSIAQQRAETMTSLQIAEITGKEHKNVMRDIRSLLDQGVSQLNFEPAEYRDEQGKLRPCFNLTKKGCLILASGYDAVLREKIINRWEELEREKITGGFQIPQTLSEALRLAADQVERIETQRRQLDAMRPKALFAEAVATSDRSCLVSEMAKILRQNGVEMGQNRLFEWLRRGGYLCTKGEYYNLPTQRAVEMGLFEIKKTTVSKPDGSVLVTTTPKITGKGQIYFVNKFLSRNNVSQQVK